jgi:hypothetical protein
VVGEQRTGTLTEKHPTTVGAVHNAVVIDPTELRNNRVRGLLLKSLLPGRIRLVLCQDKGILTLAVEAIDPASVGVNSPTNATCRDDGGTERRVNPKVGTH